MVSVETFSACCVQGVGQWIGLQPGRSLKPRYAVSAIPTCLDDADEASSILKGAQLLSSRLQSSTKSGRANRGFARLDNPAPCVRVLR